MSVRHGPITLLSVVQTGPVLEIGDTDSRYRFPVGARNFMNEWNRHGPAHHCAVGVGHIGTKLKKLAARLSMECVQVC
jgi:L-arabinose isomerase